MSSISVSARCVIPIVMVTLFTAFAVSHPDPLNATSDSNALEVHGHELRMPRSKRQVAEAMSDPYSILGFLSFGIFIFCILYQKHKRPEEKVSSGGQGGGGAGTGQVPAPIYLQALDPQIASLIKIVSDILANANNNSSKPTDTDSNKEDGDDYEDYGETSEKKTPMKKGGRRFRR